MKLIQFQQVAIGSSESLLGNLYINAEKISAFYYNRQTKQTHVVVEGMDYIVDCNIDEILDVLTEFLE